MKYETFTILKNIIDCNYAESFFWENFKESSYFSKKHGIDDFVFNADCVVFDDGEMQWCENFNFKRCVVSMDEKRHTINFNDGIHGISIGFAPRYDGYDWMIELIEDVEF